MVIYVDKICTVKDTVSNVYLTDKLTYKKKFFNNSSLCATHTYNF